METVQMPNNQIMESEPQKEGKGAWFAIIIIILIVIVGGIYFLISKQKETISVDDNKAMMNSNAEKKSDDAHLIENELNAAQDINIDAELDELDNEF